MAKSKSEKSNRLSDPATWVDQHGDYLYAFARSRVRDTHVAEDLVQETLLGAYKARDSFEGHSTERTWLVSILKNKVIDHFRKLSRESPIEDVDRVIGFPQSDFQATGEWAHHWVSEAGPGDWGADPEEMVNGREFWEILNKCLDELPPQAAMTFVLREIEQLPGEEVRKVLQITASNLWVILHRARTQLRKCLEAGGIEKL
jgi:RNA polymerase sigma-70 factor (TIGR02943 family)